MNNYRSFVDSILPIKEANFFVGENSTGKTSVLKLIHCLSNAYFWLTFDFNAIEEFDTGFFKEITTQKFFEIGTWTEGFEDGEEVVYAAKMKFVRDPKSQTAKVRELLIHTKDSLLFILNQNKQIQYKNVVLQESNLDVSDFFDRDFSDELSEVQYRRRDKQQNILLGMQFSFIFSISQLIHNRNTGKVIKSPDTREQDLYQKFAPFETKWVEPIRAEPKRIYESYKQTYSTKGEHAPAILNSIISEKSLRKDFAQIKDFGQESGLFEEISINRYSKSKTSPFEINVRFGEKKLTLANVGYGVSQVLPILTEVASTEEGWTLIIQQPEVHLHPKAQASLGEFMFDYIFREKKRLVVETHSDFLIDRYRLIIHKINLKVEEQIKNIESFVQKRKDLKEEIPKSLKNKIKKEIKTFDRITERLSEMSQVVFFERKEGKNIFHCIDILFDGKYSEEQPDSFKSFFVKEQIELFDI